MNESPEENSPPLPDGNELDGQQELVAGDDIVIARAFRWSLAVIVVGGAIAGGAYWYVNREAEAPAPEVAELAAPLARRLTATAPDVQFLSCASESGIDFVHCRGASGDKLLPETMGGGCAFFDHDGDGDADLLLVNTCARDGQCCPGPSLRLYENDGGGRFADVTRAAGLDVRLCGMGVAVGDYDGDGDRDLFVTAVGPNRLFRNDGGRFSDVTEAAGIAAGGTDEWSASAGFLDVDNDSDLDLFVCNYVKWSRQIDLELDFRLEGVGRAFGPPKLFEGSHCRLYRNSGDGTFEDVSAAAGIEVQNRATGKPLGKALALSPVDHDGDGWLDIFVANDTVQNFLFHNLGDGTFEEIGGLMGLGFDNNGMATGAMGTDAAYYRNDDSLGLAVANFAHEMTSIYVATSAGDVFTDEAIPEGIGPPSRLRLSFGLFFFDYDLDGRLDLLQANGHLEDDITVVQPSQTYRQPTQLFWNSGGESGPGFVPVEAAPGSGLGEAIVGRGAAYADIDGDGDLDVLLTQIGGPPLLLRNDQQTGHRWLRVRLIGGGENRDAIGAMVELRTSRGLQRRQVMPTRSYLSQVELPVTFGLGEPGGVGGLELTVVWPGGRRQTVPVSETDVELVVTERP